MLFLIAFIGAAVIALVLWKAMNAASRSEDQLPLRRPPSQPPTRPSMPSVSGPDDDPEFLRQLDERVRRREDPPSA